MTSSRIWLAAARPRTLPAAVAPVLIGTAIAWRDGALHIGAAVAALIGAVLIQIGTNFANDYFDFVHGADTEARLGPTRAVAAGLVAPATMRRAFVVTFALAAAAGATLIARAGWPLVVIGASGIACGILYTGGPRPLGYLGLGDVLVMVFFGPVAVAGTHYVQALWWSPTAAIAGLGPGALSVALLAVNNLRDADSDRTAGKRTLAVRFGVPFAKAEVIGMLLLAACVPVALWALGGPVGGLLATAVCAAAVPAARTVRAAQPGDRLLPALAAMGRTLSLYGIAFAIGWAWAPLGG